MNDGNHAEPQDGEHQGQAGAPAAEAEASLQDRCAQLEAEAAQYKDQALRAMAEVENVRRRAERERDDAAKYGVSQLARDLLPVADNLRRALETIDETAVAQDSALAGVLTGIQATEREFLTAIDRRGIKKLEPMGEKFDPNFHQAMFEVPTNDQPPGTVVQVLQPGYVIHDRLLRPALVGVAKPADGGAPERLNTQV